jgi:hypothetical protein
MIIKMQSYSGEEEYYKVNIREIGTYKKVYGKEITEKELKEKLVLIKHTLDIAEDYVSGDDMSCLAIGDIEDRIEIYKKVLSKTWIYVDFQKISHEEVCEL